MKKIFPLLTLLVGLLPLTIPLMQWGSHDPKWYLAMEGSILIAIIMVSFYLYMRIAKGFFARDLLGPIAVAITLVLYIVPFLFAFIDLLIYDS